MADVFSDLIENVEGIEPEILADLPSGIVLVVVNGRSGGVLLESGPSHLQPELLEDSSIRKRQKEVENGNGAVITFDSEASLRKFARTSWTAPHSLQLSGITLSGNTQLLRALGGALRSVFRASLPKPMAKVYSFYLFRCWFLLSLICFLIFRPHRSRLTCPLSM